VLELHDHTTVADRVDALHGFAARNSNRGLGRRCDTRAVVPERLVDPVVDHMGAPSQSRVTNCNRSVFVNGADDAGRQRPDVQRIPCISGLALRSMSSGTRSAGRAPSYSTRPTNDASGISTL